MKSLIKFVAFSLLYILTSIIHVNAQSFTPHWDIQPDVDWNMASGPYKHVPGTDGSPFGGPINGPSVGQGKSDYIISGTYIESWSMTNGWQVLGFCEGDDSTAFDVIAVQGNYVYVAGNFAQVDYPYVVDGEYPYVTANNIAKYNISTGVWSAVGNDDLYTSSLFTAMYIGYYPIKAMTVDLHGNIYIGFFTSLPQMLMEWDQASETWGMVGGGFSGGEIGGGGSDYINDEGDVGVEALANDGTNIFVAGGFEEVTNDDDSVLACPCIVKWDGLNHEWDAMGPGIEDPIIPGVWSSPWDFTLEESSDPFSIAVSGTNVFLAGWFRQNAAGTQSYGLARFSSVTGAVLPCANLYATNSSLGTLVNGQGEGLAVQNGNIYIGGGFRWIGFDTGSALAVNGIAMWTNDGSADGTYSGLSTGLTDSADNLAAAGPISADDNSVFVFPGWGGTVYAGDVLIPIDTDNIARWVTGAETNLELDPGFQSTSIGYDDTVWAVAVQANGQILVAGTLTTFDGQSCNCVVRLNADGSLDGTFTANAASAIPDYWWDAFCIGVDSSGKIYVGGDGAPQACLTDAGSGYLLRLNSDGTLDTTFTNTEFGSPDWDWCTVNTLVMFSSIAVEVGGNFKSYDGHSTENSASLIMTDGSYDTPWFATDGGENVISYLGSYDYAIGGAFDTLSGNSCQNVGTIGGDGSGFSNRGADGSVYGISQQTDGKLLVAGGFSTIGSDSTGAHTSLGRFNSNGTVDETFSPSLYDAANCVLAEPYGEILAGGNPDLLSADSDNGLARFKADGTLDTNFTVTYGIVHCLLQETTSTILVGGDGGVIRLRYY